MEGLFGILETEKIPTTVCHPLTEIEVTVVKYIIEYYSLVRSYNSEPA